MRLNPLIIVKRGKIWTNELLLKKDAPLREAKFAIMPKDLNICLYCRAKVTQLPGVKSECTIYCGLPSVTCGFPVFAMAETEQKGFLGCGPWVCQESPLRGSTWVFVLLLSCLLPPYFLCAPKVSSTCRNNTNLFTRLGNAEHWRVEISRNHTERKKTGKLHQVGHDVWVRYRPNSVLFF